MKDWDGKEVVEKRSGAFAPVPLPSLLKVLCAMYVYLLAENKLGNQWESAAEA